MTSGRIFDARELRFGGYFDDYLVGDVFLHWPGKTITEAENHIFCAMTRSDSPIHVDRHHGGGDEFDRNVVVGTFVYALLLGMSVPDISGRAIANLGVHELQHIAPLFHGDTLYGKSTVTATRPSRSRPVQGIIRVETTGVNQDQVAVCRFERSVLLPMRLSEARDD
jgi:acyl dehydratase